MRLPEPLAPTLTVPGADSLQDAPTPSVGDLWATAWDGTDLGHVLIVAVRPTHVVVWPVTDNSLAVSAPCFKVKVPNGETVLVAWPEAEAGVSTAALSTNFGAVLDADTLIQIWRSLRDSTVTLDSSVDTCPLDESTEADDALARVCDWVTLLGRLDFPDPDEVLGPLSNDFMEKMAIDGRTLQQFMHDSPAIVRDTLTGRRLPTPETLSRLSQAYNTKPQDMIVPITGAEVIELRSPARKSKITAIAHRRDITENEVRGIAWAETQLAARQQDGSEQQQAAARVDRALENLSI